MKFNEHGAETNFIYKQFNIKKPMKTIDFSTNTNVIHLDKNINKVIENIDLSSYPELSNNTIVDSITTHIHAATDVILPKENILVTNGSNEAIYIIASYFANKHVAILQPTYPEYEKAFLAFDAEVHYCFDTNELLNEQYKCVYICNPNNPSGSYIKWSILSQLIEKLEKLDITVIIDEAYIDFLIVEDDFKGKYDMVLNNPNLIILRSLTKIYQIAGLRLGYVICHQQWTSLIQKRQPSWSVNSVAQQVANMYLSDENIVKKTKYFYKNETQRVYDKLTHLGYELLETSVNFFLMKTKDDIKLIKYLLSHGIIVRHTRNHPGLKGDYVRIAVRSYEENNYLISKLVSYKH